MMATLLLAIAIVAAASWAKSYVRVDVLNIRTGSDSFVLIKDVNGRVWVNLSHFTHKLPVPRLRHVSFPTSESEVRYAPWTWGGLWYERWQYEPTIAPDWQCVIPHWFPLLLFGGGAWLFGRPWLRRRSHGRGFEVVRPENVSGNDATAQRPDKDVTP